MFQLWWPKTGSFVSTNFSSHFVWDELGSRSAKDIPAVVSLSWEGPLSRSPPTLTCPLDQHRTRRNPYTSAMNKFSQHHRWKFINFPLKKKRVRHVVSSTTHNNECNFVEAARAIRLKLDILKDNKSSQWQAFKKKFKSYNYWRPLLSMYEKENVKPEDNASESPDVAIRAEEEDWEAFEMPEKWKNL